MGANISWSDLLMHFFSFFTNNDFKKIMLNSVLRLPLTLKIILE